MEMKANSTPKSLSTRRIRCPQEHTTHVTHLNCSFYTIHSQSTHLMCLVSQCTEESLFNTTPPLCYANPDLPIHPLPFPSLLCTLLFPSCQTHICKTLVYPVICNASMCP